MFQFLFQSLLHDLELNNKNSIIYTCFLNFKVDTYLQSSTNARKVLDFIAGMTDDYFLDCYNMFKNK